MSTKSSAEKLRLKPGAALWASHAEHVPVLGTLPEGTRVVDSAREADVAVLFAEAADPLRPLLAEHADALGVPAFWVAYPKGNRTDVNRDSLWPILAGHGFRPVAQVSLDDVWSALRFRPLRPGEAPFTGGRTR
jgi:hypothetical protein